MTDLPPPPSRMHIKNRHSLNEFLDNLEATGVMQFPFTFNYDLLVDEQPNGNKKFCLRMLYQDTHFKNGKPLQLETGMQKIERSITPQQRLIRNGEVDDF